MLAFVNPWDDPELYRRHSPITYARDMRTPLLIQHAEKDLQKVHDDYIGKIDQMIKAKEAEIMEV